MSELPEPQVIVRCPEHWPLLDPNEEDAQEGRDHWCVQPNGHDGDHICTCGDIKE